MRLVFAPSSPTAALWRTEARETLRLAGAMALTNLLQMAVTAIDVMFVARLGQRQLATASLAVALFSLVLWCLFGLTGTVSAIIAAELGAARQHDDPEGARQAVRHAVRMGLWLCVGLGALAMGLCGLGAPILRATGQSAELAADAGRFLGWLKWAIVPMLAAGVLRNLVAALGRPIYASAITGLSIAVNAAGNYALVFGHWGAPALGLAGSAIANIVTALATFAAYLFAIETTPAFRQYRLFHRFWQADGPRLARIMRLGAPVAGGILAEAGLFNLASFLMGRLGELPLAAHTLAMQIASFAFMLPMGIGAAAAIRVGYCHGAGDAEGAGRAGWCALVVGLGFALANAALMVLAPRLLLSAYIDVGARAALASLAARYMLVAAAFQLFDSAQAILTGALRGLHDTAAPMLIALGGYWLVGLGTALWLGFATPLGGLGVWLGLAAGLVVVAAGQGWRWSRRAALGLVPGAPAPAPTPAEAKNFASAP